MKREVITCGVCREWKECELKELDFSSMRLGWCRFIKHKTTSEDYCSWGKKMGKKEGKTDEIRN